MRPVHWFRPALWMLVALHSGLWAQYDGAVPVEERLKPGFDSITAESCRQILEYLAGDECQGRASGTPGYQKAADFMAARFKAAGLKAVGDGDTFFQQVPFPRYELLADQSFLEAGDLRLACGPALSFAPSPLDVSAEVVFLAGAGEASLEDPKIVRERVVVLAAPEGPRSALRRQVSREQPAVVLQVVDGPAGAATGGPSGRGGGRGPTGVISREAATRLAAAMGMPPGCLVPPADGRSATATLTAEKKAHVVVQRRRIDLGVPNVVGLIEGSDPKLRTELVICGSHLDHLGVGSDGVVRHGADDDGSGSAAIAALARAFGTNPAKPRRSILLLAFCGEEMGLVGSRYYVEHPLFPLENVVCELQMDMIGRNEEGTSDRPEDNVRTTHLVGSRRHSTELHDLVLDCNRHVGFTFEFDEEDLYGRSDQASFGRKGIPIVFFFSGFHPDYHRPTDTVDKINFEKLTNTARLVYLVAFRAADRESRFPKDVTGR